MSALLDLLYPPRCILCRAFLPDGKESVCDRCASALLREQPVIRRGKKFDLCVSPFVYAGKLRESLHRYKFGGRKFYAKTYGSWLAACIRRELDGQYDLLTWVPVSRKRLRRRGYDQAKLLCEQTAAYLQTQAVCCLEKVADNPAQSSLSSAESRENNVKQMYRASEPARFAGKRVLLIDDIVTTGATIGECAKVLKAAGAAKVVCAALAAVT